MTRQLYLVAYDIACPARLRQALALVREFALGGQKSVFECWLNPGEREALCAALEALIDPRTDRFFLLRLHAGGRFRTLGRGRKPRDPAWFYVG